MTQISRFTERCVLVAQRVTGDGSESAATVRGDGFADYALVSLHCLRIYLDTSYCTTIDLLKEMGQMTREIGLDAADLPAPSTLYKALDRIEMSLCRVLLRQSAQLHDPSEHHAALDATFYDRDRASRHYCQRTNYRVQTLKVAKLTSQKQSADELCEVLRVHNLPRSLIGAVGVNVIAQSALSRYDHRLPYRKIGDRFEQLHGLELSGASAWYATERAARAGRCEYEQIATRYSKLTLSTLTRLESNETVNRHGSGRSPPRTTRCTRSGGGAEVSTRSETIELFYQPNQCSEPEM